MRTLLSNMSILHRFLLFFVLFVVIPVIFMYLFVTHNVSTITEKQVGKALLELVKTNHVTLDRSMAHVEDSMNKMMLSTEIQDMVNGPAGSLYERVRRYGELDKMLALTNQSATSISYSLILEDNNRLFSFIPGTEIQARGIFFSADISSQSWYSGAFNAKGKGVLSLISSLGQAEGQAQTFAMVKQMNSIWNGNTPTPGYLIVSGMEYLLQNDMAPVNISKEGQLLLLNANNQVVSLSDRFPLGAPFLLPPKVAAASEGIFQVKDEGQNWLYAMHRSLDSGTTLLYRTPLKAIIGEHVTVNRFVSVSMLLYFLMLIIVNISFIRSLIRPISRLARLSSSYEPGKPLTMARESSKSRDEIAILNNRFMDMMHRLNQTIHDKYTLEIKQREAELAILHSQINPHLLYNTLESIYWRMIVDGNTESAEMVMDLSLVMRIGLSRGKELITIGEELQHAEAYIRLQLKRHEYAFGVQWEVEEATKELLIPKVVLQPLIENAIIHGIRRMHEDGQLNISIKREEDEIYVIVEDNGFKTIAAATIRDIVEGRKTEIGYGIRNVHKRIQLHFGENYGLSYAEREGGGIQAIIHLPAMLPTSSGNRRDNDV
ncbi:MAG: sensor histidine kinase [Gorillibacterium sp.]|nr:sensor histidine kinase [Gorillibacterium sp.]